MKYKKENAVTYCVCFRCLYLLGIILIISVTLQAQNYFPEPTFSQYNYHSQTYNHVHDPVVLQQKITQGKTTDVEKFLAISAWVMQNIAYDYRSAFCTGLIPDKSIHNTLKYRNGSSENICALMDTLCSLAGIKNISINGYYKDQIFDVGDSLYIDNHVWNAVKLGNQWYLYDLSLTSGKPYFRYTKFTNLILTLKNRFKTKYKLVEIKKKNFRPFPSFCVNDYNDEPRNQKAFRYKAYNKHPFVSKFLKLFRVRLLWDFKKEFNPAYFLNDPDFFAITHLPDSPHWDLVAKRTIRKFETDSAFYKLTDSISNKHVYAGRSCPDCDNEFSFSPVNYNFYLHKQSTTLNPRNAFMPGRCNFNLGCLAFVEANEKKIL